MRQVYSPPPSPPPPHPPTPYPHPIEHSKSHVRIDSVCLVSLYTIKAVNSLPGLCMYACSLKYFSFCQSRSCSTSIVFRAYRFRSLRQPTNLVPCNRFFFRLILLTLICPRTVLLGIVIQGGNAWRRVIGWWWRRVDLKGKTPWVISSQRSSQKPLIPPAEAYLTLHCHDVS